MKDQKQVAGTRCEQIWASADMNEKLTAWPPDWQSAL
jgi:hypothetical protein